MSHPRSPLETLSARISDFEHRKKIGAGKDCVIYRALWTSRPEPRTVVVKAYDRTSVSATKVRAIKREARMMDTVNHKGVPHVVGYYGTFQDARCYYVVMEFCGNGDLLEKILGEGRAMEERRVVNEVAVPLLISLTAMHQLSLIHRDIKLENIFVDDRDRVKFGDFGLTMSKEEERGISPVGTVDTPHKLRLLPRLSFVGRVYGARGQMDPLDVEPVDEKVDIWALGVTFYELLTGRSPFEGGDKATLKRNIIKYKLRKLPRYLSTESEDFLRQMMRYRPEDRASARELLKHPWIEKHAENGFRAPSSISDGTAQDMRASRNQSESITPIPGATQQRSKHVDRFPSESSPAPPRVSPESMLFVTERRKEKFRTKLARLLPIYKSPHEEGVCMRGLWTLEISDSDEDVM